MLNSSHSMQRDLEQDNGYFSVLVLRKNWSSISKDIVHKVNGSNSQKADIQCFESRVHCPEVNSKAKAVDNCRPTIVPTWKRFKLFFRTITSVNKLSLYWAVAEMCEECKSCHVRTGRLVLVEQADPLFVLTSVMNTPALHPLTDDRAQEDLLQRYQIRVERPSQQNRVGKFCTDAGFLTIWLMSDSASWQKTLKNSHNLENQWHVVSKLCQEMKKFIWPERLDSKEYQNWTSIASHNQLPAR